jgi:hypothetical protein
MIKKRLFLRKRERDIEREREKFAMFYDDKNCR